MGDLTANRFKQPVLHRGTLQDMSQNHESLPRREISTECLVEISKGKREALRNNRAEGELINQVAHMQGKSWSERWNETTLPLLPEKPINLFVQWNKDDEVGTPIDQKDAFFNAHLRFILLAIFAVSTLTLCLMIRFSANKTPSFFKRSPSLLYGLVSSLLSAVMFSLLSLETMAAKCSKFTCFCAYTAILSFVAAVGLLLSLALVWAV